MRAPRRQLRHFSTVDADRGSDAEGSTAREHDERAESASGESSGAGSRPRPTPRQRALAHALDGHGYTDACIRALDVLGDALLETSLANGSSEVAVMLDLETGAQTGPIVVGGPDSIPGSEAAAQWATA